ncbi:hypothetical protein GGQ74_002905 [Desulfobaculum xiamenense]|uniref:Sulfotransferase family protein n=1 Tax=Desulfobaculum xiamenense TaxID=995050 RepID=A0A846QM19_9BACT|nr:sulfotransferase [Desulfobaculum xiamenense]NJB69208.1 hypothetical protein [Desulfobaculum xiamenense]
MAPLRGEDFVFVVGSPRSGTTWLQRLLSCHPLVATGQESGVFDSYIGPQLRAWRRDMAPDSTRPVGLGCHMTEAEFMAALTAHMDALLASMRVRIPEGGLFVEKTPSHALYMREIAELMPGARFVHMLRDAREVITSMVVASRTWGEDWAPRCARDAALLWARHVNAALAAGRELGPERVTLVRHEDLRADTAAVLARLVRGFLRLDWEDAAVAEAVERNLRRRGLDGMVRPGVPLPLGGEWSRRLGTDAAPEPEGFAGGGGWRPGFVGRISAWVAARRAMERAGYPWRQPWRW